MWLASRNRGKSTSVAARSCVSSGTWVESFIPAFLGGELLVSASATRCPTDARTYEGRRPNVQARALELEEIPRIVSDYVRAARNAIDAGFDGVQLHAGSGYLIEQFLRDGTNQRQDRYGGSIDYHRLRFLLEIVAGIGDAISPQRLSVRFSLNTVTQNAAGFGSLGAWSTAAAKALSRFDLAFLELREPGLSAGIFGVTGRSFRFLR